MKYIFKGVRPEDGFSHSLNLIEELIDKEITKKEYDKFTYVPELDAYRGLLKGVYYFFAAIIEKVKDGSN
jgi:hypothetical protein